jgi:LysM repeat protein
LWAAPTQRPVTAPLAQSTPAADEAGQEYIIQPGDSLYKISGQFYNEPGAYQRIVDATNAKAAVDSRFTRIANPRFIQTGQRLWIPDSTSLPIVDASASATTGVTDEPTPTETEAETETETEAEATSGRAAMGVRFVDPLDGAVVAPTFVVTMVANELTVEPAGAINPDAGHFHILVDTDFVPAGEIIITDEQHLHFGQGQLTTTLSLEPGEHVLRLQFANGAHIALDGDIYRDTITVTVDAAVAALEPHDHTATAVDVHFVTPLDGATVSGRFDVVMAADGLIVEPAGAINANAGHFHILVDTDFVPAGDLIITDEQHLHYGQGQAVTRLDLSPGEHVLRLQFANGAHIALAGEHYRDEITVTVTE